MSEPSCNAYLEAVIDGQPMTFLLHTGSLCRIGRSDQNTIVLLDHQVSREHAMIQVSASGEFYLSDLGSRNGTLLNRRLITAPALLKPGDRISIGAHEFVFHCAARAAAVRNVGRGETVADFSLQLITVLVADIRDFTALSRRIGEAKLSQTISAFMREGGLALKEEGAWGQKYIGDAVMSIWVHLGEAPELSEMVGVLTGLQKLYAIAAGLQPQFGLDAPIRFGAGINTGTASLGNMGSDAAADYTALSEAVNLAFRLESATRQLDCDLALGHKTFEYLNTRAPVAELFQRHLLPLKGYRQPVTVYAGMEAALPKLLKLLQARNPIGETQIIRV